MPEKIKLAFLWHMHQPYYRDPLTKQFEMPWVRLHGLKDYWGMVTLLDEFPRARMTFNLVPSLLSQIEDILRHPESDPFFSLAFQSVASLTTEQKDRMHTQLFQARMDHQIGRFPRFQELHHRVFGSPDCDARIRFSQLRNEELTDLQVLSQLCWFDELYLKSDGVIQELVKKGHHFTESDKHRLREKELELLSKIIPAYRHAARQGQIEISTSPFYHPILPLLCDTSMARHAQPHALLPKTPFKHPEDAELQLYRAMEKHQSTFGQAPAGLWPSEGSVSNEVLEIVERLNFRWVATDEGILERSLGFEFHRDAQGAVSPTEWLHAPVRFKNSGLHLFFRDRELSDALGFTYSRMQPLDAAETFIRRLKASVANTTLSAPCVTIALDGENAWEFYPENGRPFLRALYGLLSEDPQIEMVTFSEALSSMCSPPRSLNSVWPGSWIDSNFAIWIGDTEDNRAWDLLTDAREAFENHLRAHPDSIADANIRKARESLLAAEGSDWCWWYGPEHSSVNDLRFDALFRSHLIHCYQQIGIPVPEVLAEPLKRHLPKQIHIPPSAHIHPCIDGWVSSYFEWMGAGSVEELSVAMHQGRRRVTKVFYGWDETWVYFRCDFSKNAGENKERLDMKVFVGPGSHLLLQNVMAPQTEIPATFYNDRMNTSQPLSAKEAMGAFQKIFEIRFLKSLCHLNGSGTRGFWVVLEMDGIPVDRFPLRGSFQVEEVLLGE